MPHPNDTEGRTAMLVEYRCPNCDNEWESKWTCACDDDCGKCGTVVEALDWTELHEDPDAIDGGP